ncbi:glycerophosphodiester phosphodiesterase [Ideonella livida]|uniref:Glycerophosphodiester phosphodiesterase n=1 Tax=Ideonella livida TaxID=2707176 RepID=A0A7C9TGY3_9BURK|nr:glycerophosphodiester phosphodiesterase [Ideonella livida]NDY89998.1 glycerophosphodiester phosphodiesterase [Ideonella livida]
MSLHELPPLPAWPYPFWIAHRGAGLEAPENTLGAFRVGAALGWRAFECDVKLSADGVPFLMHDSTLDRTTNRQGPCGVLDWSSLSRLDAGSWHSPAFAGEPPANLEDLAAWLLPQDLLLNLELKPVPGQAERTGTVVATTVARLWAGRTPPLLSSFEPQALAAARAAAPDLPRALLLETLRPGWLRTAESLGCVAVVTHHRLMQPTLRAQLRAAGMRALVYTVNEPEEARRLVALGIDGLISDAVRTFDPRRDPRTTPGH